MPVPLALGICAVPGLIFGTGVWLGALQSFVGGLAAFAFTTPWIIGLFAESMFVEQRIHEHGLVLGGSVPGVPSMAIPYAAIDFASIRPGPLERVSAEDRFNIWRNRRVRQVWGSGVVRFTSITTDEARRLAKGTESWERLVEGFQRLPNSSVRLRAGEEWVVGFRDNTQAAAELADAVAREQGVSQ